MIGHGGVGGAHSLEVRALADLAEDKDGSGEVVLDSGGTAGSRTTRGVRGSTERARSRGVCHGGCLAAGS